MAVTVKDLLSLDIMKDFKVITGKDGLNNTIAATEILDFEFLKENELKRERTFDGNSIVLSSFLFAKDNPICVFDAVKELIQLNVHALAYKPIFFKELPQDALDYAEKSNFPILEFGGDEFFEDIIFSIRSLIEKDQAVNLLEEELKEMVFRDYSDEEASLLYEKLNPSFRHEVFGICIKDRDSKEEDLTGVLRNGTLESSIKNKIFMGKIEDKYILILSQDDANMNGFMNLFENVKKAYGLDKENITVGFSKIQNIDDGIDRVIKEAYWAEKVAEIESVNKKCYKDIGVYRLIGAHFHSNKMISFMQDYLSPILEDEGKEGDLFDTAVEYILASGDVVKTGERLFCHKNTIRYRIAKLQEKLDPTVNEKEFYQNLSTAIKIYLLHNK